MNQLAISIAVRRDRRDIAKYTALSSPMAAKRIVDRILARINELRPYPFLGPAFEKQADLRFLTESEYVILYSVRKSRVQVARVVHGSRDIEAQLS